MRLRAAEQAKTALRTGWEKQQGVVCPGGMDSVGCINDVMLVWGGGGGGGLSFEAVCESEKGTSSRASSGRCPGAEDIGVCPPCEC